jgi:hypothetical protein
MVSRFSILCFEFGSSLCFSAFLNSITSAFLLCTCAFAGFTSLCTMPICIRQIAARKLSFTPKKKKKRAKRNLAALLASLQSLQCRHQRASTHCMFLEVQAISRRVFAALSCRSDRPSTRSEEAARRHTRAGCCLALISLV